MYDFKMKMSFKNCQSCRKFEYVKSEGRLNKQLFNPNFRTNIFQELYNGLGIIPG